MAVLNSTNKVLLGSAAETVHNKTKSYRVVLELKPSLVMTILSKTRKWWCSKTLFSNSMLIIGSKVRRKGVRRMCLAKVSYIVYLRNFQFGVERLQEFSDIGVGR